MVSAALISCGNYVMILQDVFASLFCLSDTFLVAFDQTIYTMIESEDSVEVCVNLTYPMFDILDEFATVEVFWDPQSIYIPPNATLPSKSPC